MAASADERSLQASNEEAAATKGPPHKKQRMDEGRLQAIEEVATAPAPSSLPTCKPDDATKDVAAPASSRDKVTVRVDVVSSE